MPSRGGQCELDGARMLSTTIPNQKKNSKTSRSNVRVSISASSRGQNRATRRRRPRRTRVNRDIVSRVHDKLSPPGSLFLSAIADPFHTSLRAKVYQPDAHAVPSQKVCGRTRLVISIASGQSCFLLVNPSLTSDKPSVFTYNGNPGGMNPSGATGYAGVNIPLPYSSANVISNALSCRATCFGMRVRYTGSILNRGGSAIWLNDVTDGGQMVMSGSESSGNFDQFLPKWKAWEQTRYVNFNHDDCHDFVMVPAQFAYDGQVVFSGGSYSNNHNWYSTTRDATSFDGRPFSGKQFGVNYGSTGTSYHNPPAVLVLQNNNSSNALEFTIEMVYHVEYAGGTANIMSTASPPHVTDHALIQQSYLTAAQTHSADPDTHHSVILHNTLHDAMNAGLGFAKEAVVSGLKSLATPKNAERLGLGLASMFL